MSPGSEKPPRRDHTAKWLDRTGPEGLPRQGSRAAVAIVTVGTVVPLLVAVGIEGFLELYVDPATYNSVAGIGVGLGIWLLVDAFDLDQWAVGHAVLLGPILLVTVGVSALTIVGHDLRSFVLTDPPFYQYPLVISTGGAIAVALSLLTERLWAREPSPSPPLPTRRAVTTAVGTTALLGLGAVAGRRAASDWQTYTTPPDGRIHDVHLLYHEWGVRVWPELEVESTPYQVAAVAPDGTVARERITADQDVDPLPVLVPYPDDAIPRGRFEVRLESDRGDVGDSITTVVEDGPIPSIRRVDTGTTPPYRYHVDLVVANDGDVSSDFSLELRGTDHTLLDRSRTIIEPGETYETTLEIDYARLDWDEHEIDGDPDGPRSAVVTVRFAGPDADGLEQRREIEFESGT